MKTALLQILFVAAMAAKGSFDADVIECHDGDTCRVVVVWSFTQPEWRGQTLTLRLEGMDAPELKQRFGPAAADATSSRVDQLRVHVAWSTHDKYGRVVGRAFYGGDEARDLQLEMISAGLAWSFKPSWMKKLVRVFPARPRDAWVRDYIAAEKAARAKRLGLWKDPAPVAPWEYRRKLGLL